MVRVVCSYMRCEYGGRRRVRGLGQARYGCEVRGGEGRVVMQEPWVPDVRLDDYEFMREGFVCDGRMLWSVGVRRRRVSSCGDAVAAIWNIARG
jgi:hypothetical protein